MANDAWISASFVSEFSRGEAFAARAVSDGVWVGDFETAFLEVVAEVEFGSTDEECALGIDHDTDIAALHEDVPVCRAISEVHFVLQSGASSADHSDAESTAWAALFFQEAAQFAAGGPGNADEFFVAEAVLHIAFSDK